MKKTLFQYLLIFSSASIHAQTDLNLSFEKILINDSINQQPVNWAKLKTYASGEIVSDSYDGKWAVKIWTWYTYLQGVFHLGNTPKGIAFSQKPLLFKGFYKYELGDNLRYKDSAEVFVFLKKYNQTVGKTDTIAIGYKTLGPIADYTQFNVPIKYNQEVSPDSIAIIFVSSKMQPRASDGSPTSSFCGSSGSCTYLTIDNLSFEYTTPTTPDLKSPIKIYPNPTHSTLQLAWGENNVNQVIIKDTMGRILHRKAANTEGVTLDTSTWAAGIYFIEFINNSKEVLTVQKVIKQ